MSLLSSAIAAASVTLRDTAGEEISYTRGATTLTLTASRGSNRQSIAFEAVAVIVREVDFLINVADLTLGVPLAGDIIVDAYSQRYMVAPIAGDGSTHYTTQGTVHRIHCRRTR